MKPKHIVALLLTLIFSTLLQAKPIQLVGLGATFPNQFYQQAFKIYENTTRVPVSYIPQSSSQGFQALKNQSVDFSGLDLFISDSLIKTLPDPQDVIHIPTCLSGISVVYNLPGVQSLQLNAEVLSLIFQNKITVWSDSRIQEINPDVILPNDDIVVIYRDKGSGSSYIMTQYLTMMDESWKDSINVTMSPEIPNGVKAPTSKQVAKLIKQVKGSIGYVGLSYANDINLSKASIQNKQGEYILPTIDSITKSANYDLPKDARTFIVGSNVPGSYPLTSFSWIVVYKEQSYNKRSKKQAKELKSLLSWIINEGQNNASETGYAPLSERARSMSEALIETMTFKNKVIKNR